MHARRTFPRAALLRREQMHRRAVLLGLGVLLVLSTSPLIGHHLPSGIEGYLAGKDHLWALCLVALHLLLAPIHSLFHLLFFGGLAFALWDRARAWRTQRRILSSLEAAPPQPGDAFWEAALAAGVDARALRVVEGLPSPAFTAGWLWPRIYVARVLAARLSAEELTAVIAHEGAHVARRDPLRASLLRLLTCTLFWLPALGWLAEDIADEAEIQADDAAARERPLALASALLALAQWGRPRTAGCGEVGFDERDLLERRVRRLAGEEITPRSRVTRRSLLGAAVAVVLVWTSGAVVAHPLPGGRHGHAEHCEQHGIAAVSHLFCRGGSASAAGDHCPDDFRH